ncbi:unnamed protein product [Prorocentrum cordatum]|uniref:Uncharacterized protein n=1 Tax=Prorocentrum cordatum TaxID=2364126 RepID=A0ABN9XXA7_9DINO|nr:unnamed protein product [Polarella glacialis]
MSGAAVPRFGCAAVLGAAGRSLALLCVALLLAADCLLRHRTSAALLTLYAALLTKLWHPLPSPCEPSSLPGAAGEAGTFASVEQTLAARSNLSLDGGAIPELLAPAPLTRACVLAGAGAAGGSGAADGAGAEARRPAVLRRDAPKGPSLQGSGGAAAGVHGARRPVVLRRDLPPRAAWFRGPAAARNSTQALSEGGPASLLSFAAAQLEGSLRAPANHTQAQRARLLEDLAEVYAALVGAYSRRADHAGAARAAERALRAAVESGSSRAVARCHNSWGHAEMARLDFEAARGRFGDALRTSGVVDLDPDDAAAVRAEALSGSGWAAMLSARASEAAELFGGAASLMGVEPKGAGGPRPCLPIGDGLDGLRAEALSGLSIWAWQTNSSALAPIELSSCAAGLLAWEPGGGRGAAPHAGPQAGGALAMARAVVGQARVRPAAREALTPAAEPGPSLARHLASYGHAMILGAGSRCPPACAARVLPLLRRAEGLEPLGAPWPRSERADLLRALGSAELLSGDGAGALRSLRRAVELDEEELRLVPGPVAHGERGRAWGASGGCKTPRAVTAVRGARRSPGAPSTCARTAPRTRSASAPPAARRTAWATFPSDRGASCSGGE